jgi:pimeloyl-ACP methyl ester carboxylesterase
MRRAAFVAGLTAAVLPPPCAAGAESTAYDLVTPTGTLGGTLDVPAATRPPVVLVIAGSGAVDRDGNVGVALRSDVYRLLGAALVARGVACVRFDKRGVAGSRAALAADPATVTIESPVADVVAWIAKLRADGRFANVVIAGHSAGALIGMLAAQRASVDAFVSLEGPGRTLDQTLRAQLGDRLATSPALLAASQRIMDQLAAGKTPTDVPPELVPLFNPGSYAYERSEFAIDPAVQIAKLTAPCTIVQGTYDLQVSVDDGKRLAAAVPAARFVLVEHMSHMLKIATSAVLSEQVATVYGDPALPVAPAVVDAVVAATHA